jgi:hypothetical protein
MKVDLDSFGFKVIPKDVLQSASKMAEEEEMPFHAQSCSLLCHLPGGWTQTPKFANFLATAIAKK